MTTFDTCAHCFCQRRAPEFEPRCCRCSAVVVTKQENLRVRFPDGFVMSTFSRFKTLDGCSRDIELIFEADTKLLHVPLRANTGGWAQRPVPLGVLVDVPMRVFEARGTIEERGALIYVYEEVQQ